MKKKKRKKIHTYGKRTNINPSEEKIINKNECNKQIFNKQKKATHLTQVLFISCRQTVSRENEITSQLRCRLRRSDLKAKRGETEGWKTYSHSGEDDGEVVGAVIHDVLRLLHQAGLAADLSGDLSTKTHRKTQPF